MIISMTLAVLSELFLAWEGLVALFNGPEVTHIGRELSVLVFTLLVLQQVHGVPKGSTSASPKCALEHVGGVMIANVICILPPRFKVFVALVAKGVGGCFWWHIEAACGRWTWLGHGAWHH